MKAFQLIANGTEMKSRKNKNIASKKVFLNIEDAEGYKDEFYNKCINPIEGCDIFLDSKDKHIPVEIRIIDLELVGEIKNV